MPNHLDRHGNMDAYAAAKMNLFAFQGPADTLVLNADCPATRNWAKAARGRVVFFSAGDDPFELAVPGGHNQANAQAAWQACRALGVDRPTASQALRQFGGLPHRLNLVCKVDEVRYFNDSKCTTPQGAMVALDGFDPRRVVMIVGGYDKGASFAELGRRLAERAKAVIAIGATAGKIVAAVEAATAATEAGPLVRRAGSLPDAVAAARELAEPGDAVLLSPACASYDMFDNYEQRGELFERLARPIT
jgi:UDP-N-acetylmuramoylalanine--D-glutamate ligase